MAYGVVNRLRVTVQTILKTQSAPFAGILIPVRSSNIKITLPFQAEIFLDGELTIRAPGTYIIKRAVDTIRIRVSIYRAGPIESNEGNRGVCWIETGPSDIEFSEINPDLLPVATFGLKSAFVAVGLANTLYNTAQADWFAPQGLEVPECIWVKSVFGWIESPGGLPPIAGEFMYGWRLFKNDSDAIESWRILEGNGDSFGRHFPFHNAMIPLANLYEVRAAETPIISWFVDTSAAPVGGFNVTMGVIASYLRQAKN